MEESAEGAERRWLRPLGLLAVTFLLSVVQPVVLVVVPLALLAVTSRERRGTAFLVALLAGLLAVGGASDPGLWYLERGWAVLVGGCFVALSLRWPGTRFLTRGLGAVAGAFLAAGLLFWTRPEGWAVADWTITTRLSRGAGAALEAFRVLQGDGSGVSSALATAVHETAAIQGKVFPALLGLASVAGLGVAWWLYRRLVHGTDRGLGPLGDFRFNDQLIWVLITGCLLLLLAEGGWSRTGANAVVFMGGLYALRGAAVVVFLAGGVSLFGAIMAGLGLILLPPLILAGALVIGLGDTWLDLRVKARALTG